LVIPALRAACGVSGINTQSNQELKSDFVTKSMLSYGQAIEIVKQILKLKNQQEYQSPK
jgi:hypothetical protein